MAGTEDNRGMNEDRRGQFNAPLCDFAEEGYPATYVLRALDGADLARFRAHLPTCPVCTAEVATFGVTAAQFPLALDEADPARQPAPELRGRILAAIAAERDDRPADVPREPIAFPAGPRWPQAYAIAAVLLLALGLGLLGWNLNIQRDLRQARSERDQAQAALAETRFQLAATGGGGAISGEIVYLPDRQQAVIVVNGLPPLAAGQVYQLWLIDGGTPQPSTVFLTPTTAVQANLGQYQAAAITIEPGPVGSRAPTTTPLAIAALRP